jgi:hypothetical protein
MPSTSVANCRLLPHVDTRRFGTAHGAAHFERAVIIDAAALRLSAVVASLGGSTTSTSMRGWVDGSDARAEMAGTTSEQTASATLSISQAAQALNAERLRQELRSPNLPSADRDSPTPGRDIPGDALPPGLARRLAEWRRGLAARAAAGGGRPTSTTAQPRTAPARGAAAKGSLDSAVGGASASDAAIDDAGTTDPRLLALIGLIERLTGQKVRLLRASDMHPHIDEAAMAAIARAAEAAHVAKIGNVPQRQGWGLSVDVHAEQSTTATLDLIARAVVRTADGREIAVAMDLSMSQTTSRAVDVRIRLGDAKLVDPLALDLNGDGLNLSTATFTFDMQANGGTETFRSLAPGDAFLAVDRNGSGTIDSGAELFGPASGNGFTELAASDTDHNGWIDEADPIFNELKVWNPAARSLMGLREAGIGAIALASVAAPMDLSAGGAAAGRLTAAGAYLTETGTAGMIGNIDLIA